MAVSAVKGSCVPEAAQRHHAVHDLLLPDRHHRLHAAALPVDALLLLQREQGRVRLPHPVDPRKPPLAELCGHLDRDPPADLHQETPPRSPSWVTLLQLFTSSFAAYAFAKMQFKGKNVLFLGYIATIAVPWQAYMVPQFMMMSSWGLNNTHLAIMCLQAFSAFGVFFDEAVL